MSATARAAMRSLLTDADRDELRAIEGLSVAFDEPLAPYTSWKLGGPADAWIVVEDETRLSAVMRFCLRRRIPWFVLGSGTNLLVGDGGIRGLVLRLRGTFASVTAELEGDRVIVHAGASADMALLTAKAASLGASGIDSLAGIPGSVGGSVRMNAGTDREIGDFITDVRVQSPTKPDAHSITVQYFYRHTTLAHDAVVTRVTLAFERGDTAEIREKMKARLMRRKVTQPLAFPNAGSCFRNPNGEKTARLIQEIGAKGWREGGAEVSQLHANFINNTGGATSRDVATLLARVRRAVFDACGVELQLEVHLVGVFI